MYLVCVSELQDLILNHFSSAIVLYFRYINDTL